jgi:hypothetical protein
LSFRGNISLEGSGRLGRFRCHKYRIDWFNTFHPVTRRTYQSHLFELLGALKLTPTELINKAANTDNVKISANQRRCDLISFNGIGSWSHLLGNIIVLHVGLHSVVERNATISCQPRHSDKSLVDPRLGSDHLHHLHRSDGDSNEQVVSRKDPRAYLECSLVSRCLPQDLRSVPAAWRSSAVYSVEASVKHL